MKGAVPPKNALPKLNVKDTIVYRTFAFVFSSLLRDGNPAL
jgi:hypothetical protein